MALDFSGLSPAEFLWESKDLIGKYNEQALTGTDRSAYRKSRQLWESMAEYVLALRYPTGILAVLRSIFSREPSIYKANDKDALDYTELVQGLLADVRSRRSEDVLTNSYKPSPTMSRKIDAFFPPAYQDQEDDDDESEYSDGEDPYRDDEYRPNVAMSANLMKALGMDTSHVDTATDWKPPERSGLQYSKPIVDTNERSRGVDPPHNEESEEDSDDYYDREDEPDGEYEVRGNVAMSANLMKALGMDTSHVDTTTDWKPPERSGLQYSKPIVERNYRDRSPPQRFNSHSLDSQGEEDDDDESEYSDGEDPYRDDEYRPNVAMSANLMKALGMDTSHVDTATDWKPPERSGLQYSKPIVGKYGRADNYSDNQSRANYENNLSMRGNDRVDPHSVRGIQQKQSILASKQLQPQVPKQERRSYQLPIRDTTGRTYTGREGSGNRRSTYEEEMLYKSSPIMLERSLAVYEEDSRSRHSRGSYYRASSSRLSSPDSAYTTRSQSTTRSGKSDFIRSELPVRPAPAGKQREIKRRVKHFT